MNRFQLAAIRTYDEGAYKHLSTLTDAADAIRLCDDPTLQRIIEQMEHAQDSASAVQIIKDATALRTQLTQHAVPAYA